jgi:hypothetical protein
MGELDDVLTALRKWRAALQRRQPGVSPPPLILFWFLGCRLEQIW